MYSLSYRLTYCHIGSTHFSCSVMAKAFAGAVCYNGVKRASSVTLDEILQSPLPKVRFLIVFNKYKLSPKTFITHQPTRSHTWFLEEKGKRRTILFCEGINILEDNKGNVHHFISSFCWKAFVSHKGLYKVFFIPHSLQAK